MKAAAWDYKFSENLPGEPVLPPVKIEIVKEHAQEEAPRGKLKTYSSAMPMQMTGQKRKFMNWQIALLTMVEWMYFLIDIFTETPEGWQKWMQTSIDQADYIWLCLWQLTEKRWDKEEEPGIGRGVTRESVIIDGQLYKAGGLNTKANFSGLTKRKTRNAFRIFSPAIRRIATQRITTNCIS